MKIPDHESLSRLLFRLEAAEGPDRELDHALALTFQWEPKHHANGTDEALPRWTASLDASLALVERLGWRIFNLDARRAGRFEWTICRPSDIPNNGIDYAIGLHRELVTALLCALVKALIAKGA